MLVVLVVIMIFGQASFVFGGDENSELLSGVVTKIDKLENLSDEEKAELRDFVSELIDDGGLSITELEELLKDFDSDGENTKLEFKQFLEKAEVKLEEIYKKKIENVGKELEEVKKDLEEAKASANGDENSEKDIEELEKKTEGLEKAVKNVRENAEKVRKRIEENG